jgi:hypothetical protein
MAHRIAAGPYNLSEQRRRARYPSNKVGELGYPRKMDYGTFFFTNIVSVSVFAVCVSLLAWYNRRVEGMRWFAGAMIVGLVKLILQGLEGKVPTVLSSMLANELYLISFTMQWMGLCWFVVRKPLRNRWPWIAVGLVLAAYTGLYLGKIPYSGNVINIPFVMVCGASAWILFRHGRPPFAVVSRVAAVVLCGALYSAVGNSSCADRPALAVFAGGHGFSCHLHGDVRPVVSGDRVEPGTGRAGTHGFPDRSAESQSDGRSGAA